MKKLLAVSTLIGLVMVIAACGDDPLGTRPFTTQDAAPVASEVPAPATEPTKVPEAQESAPTQAPVPTSTAPPAPTASPPPSLPVPAQPSDATATAVPSVPAAPTAQAPLASQPTATPRPPAPTHTPLAAPTTAPAPPAEPEPVVTPEALFLKVTSPEDEATVDASTLTVVGETTPDAVVNINGRSVEVDADGVFSADVDLVEGINFIEIVASDFDGNSAEAVRTLIYSPRQGQ